jgi:small subunit ribosomal protein S8
MSRTDLLSDVVAAIKNAAAVRHDTLTVPYSKFVMQVLEMLKREGYIDNCKKVEEGAKAFIKIYLKYLNKKSVIRHLVRTSTPSRRRYAGKDEIRPVLRGKGFSVVTTSKGLMTDKEARELAVGGEVVITVW